ncbi:MAG: nicotinate phosphoribosyltransferase [Dehalococcoidia bacterium]
MADVVLVIDMLRGFLEEGHPLYCGEGARRIIPSVHKLLEEETARGSRIIYSCDNHTPDDPEFEMFPPHCIIGTEETGIIPELAEFAGEIVPTRHYSGFYDSTLDEKLAEISPEKLIVCGVCTDICVMHTVADARNRGYDVEVPVDCVASFDEDAHRFALSHLENVLGAVLTHREQSEQGRFTIPRAVISGETADIYFVRSREILEKEDLNPVCTMEVFSRREGIICGMNEVMTLLNKVLPEGNREVWALSEEELFRPREVVLRITAPLQSFVVYETAYLGILASCCAWATAARECVDAAQGIPVLSFGARHVHPSSAGVMEYAAIVGGCIGCASTAGARLAGTEPIGTIPHALILAMGDTARATLAFDKNMPADISRVALVDTFRYEPEESVIVAKEMGGRLEAVRLDTPSELGGVTVELVQETRARLDEAGFRDVKIYISGGMNPERIRQFVESNAPVDTFAVGSYISGARPIDFTADIHEVDGKPLAKRGRTPGITPNPRLKQII